MTNSDTPVTLPVKRTRRETLSNQLTENAYKRILPARYLRKEADGTVVETPEELFKRIAENIAQAEAEYGNDADEWATRFEGLMTGLEFMPNSPTLMNAGTELQQLAACFVISPEDTMESIFQTLKQAALVLQTGGGVGYSFSRLRPKGDIVRSTGGTASGPVSFMHVYDSMCEEIKQGGKRRGAQMGILRVDHPDIGQFCVAKRNEGVLSNFNISVGIADSFYDAVQRDEEYALYNPRTGNQHRVTKQTMHFYNPAYEEWPASTVEENFWRDYAAEISGVDEYREALEFDIGDSMTLPARFVWTILVDSAWRNGEPGLFMLDETNHDHTFDIERHPRHIIDATNPCGEQGLENFEACTLGHVNLSLIVADDVTPWFAFQEDVHDDLTSVVQEFLQQAIDRGRLSRITRDGTRFLDDVITMNEAPIPEIDTKMTSLRKIGLGIMGFAELLIQLGIRYGSPASFEVARQLMAHINRESKRMSHELAEERGVFPEWNDSKYASPEDYPEWFERHTGHKPERWSDGFEVRNHSTTTIAPTGTTSMIANTSSGCEPLYNVAYFKNVAEDVSGDEPFVEFDDYFLRVLKVNDIDVPAIKAEAQDLLRTGEFEGPHSLAIPDAIAEMFVTAREIPPSEHVLMQAAFQEHVDSAISKTINFPREATRENVDEAYRLAIERGCKGITVYRDRSRRVQVLTVRPLEGEVVSPNGMPEEARCCPL